MQSSQSHFGGVRGGRGGMHINGDDRQTEIMVERVSNMLMQRVMTKMETQLNQKLESALQMGTSGGQQTSASTSASLNTND